MFEPLPALIRLQREAQGLTIDALSALARVSRTRLIALEKGDDNISLELLVKITNALGMTELRIGGLRVTAATSDFNAMVIAAEALQVARRIVRQAASADEEINRLSRPVAEALAPVITSAKPGAESKDEARAKRGRKRA